MSAFTYSTVYVLILHVREFTRRTCCSTLENSDSRRLHACILYLPHVGQVGTYKCAMAVRFTDKLAAKQSFAFVLNN